jgi:hypothetical protein
MKTLIKETKLEKHKKYWYFNYHIKVIMACTICEITQIQGYSKRLSGF